MRYYKDKTTRISRTSAVIIQVYCVYVLYACDNDIRHICISCLRAANKQNGNGEVKKNGRNRISSFLTYFIL